MQSEGSGSFIADARVSSGLIIFVTSAVWLLFTLTNVEEEFTGSEVWFAVGYIILILAIQSLAIVYTSFRISTTDLIFLG